MKKIKQYRNVALALSFALVVASCSDDDNNVGPDTDSRVIEGNEAYVLGVGVTVGNTSTNYIVQKADLLSGKISLLNNGILQEGYREYFNIDNYFYSIGGLGVNNVDAYYVSSEGRIEAKTGKVFKNGLEDYIAIDGGKTILGVNVVEDAQFSGNVEFVTVDAAGYEISEPITVNTKEVYRAPKGDHGWNHTGIVVRGNRAFQTIYPYGTGSVTPNVDTNYVAIYSYPDFKLDKVIKDTRTGPAGAVLVRSGIIATETGDLYTISHDAYGFDQKSEAKDPAILKIAAGTEVFDPTYHFKTVEVANGGKIIRAGYVGNNKLFAQIKRGPQKGAAPQWDQTELQYAIVDLVKQEIIPVQNTPTYDGAEDWFIEGDKVYIPAKTGSALNIYQVDIPTATATKGVEIEATYVKGIGKLTK